MKIIIQPSSDKLDSNILNLLVESISKEFVNSKVTINPLLKFDIHNFIPKQRNQLRFLTFCFGFRKTQTIKRDKDFSHL